MYLAKNNQKLELSLSTLACLVLRLATGLSVERESLLIKATSFHHLLFCHVKGGTSGEGEDQIGHKSTLLLQCVWSLTDAKLMVCGLPQLHLRAMLEMAMNIE